MKVRNLLVTVLLLVLVVASGLVPPEAKAEKVAKDCPNIVLIMADDIGWESIGCYGSEDYKTPHIDGLAAKGIRFDHCYSTPICTTSRVKIMTGKYNFRNYTHFGYLNPNAKTFGHLLKNAGYKTAIAGKWQLNGLYNQLDGFDDSSRPIHFGFDEYLLWQLTESVTKNGRGGERYWSPPLECNGEFLSKESNRGKYGPDLVCTFICDFIEQNRDEPFFVYYPMVLVHNPFVATPASIRGLPDAESNNGPKDKTARKNNYGGMVEYMDQIVGRIVDKLEEVDLLENTIILFTADNGTNRAITSRWQGRDIRGGKGGMTDTGTRVPLVTYWKGHTPLGEVSKDLVDFTDFYATFAEAAGVQLLESDRIDGRSFFAQLHGENGKPRNWVLCHYQPYWNKVPGRFVRNQRFKLYDDGRLFDVGQDLEETMNLADSSEPTIAQVKKELQRILDRCPPPPKSEKLGKDAKHRPVYPEWESLFRHE